ncbi:glutamate racemase [Arcticibacterium luteifluviistationis]|uniref:glutamate racemase n=1 Tax=Arcticibacterium luteifluviistationis TaxID=1784714 RepID=UPI0013A6F9B8|nr:glutamate racemase [Arcticibacterium luteifluviistationis]
MIGVFDSGIGGLTLLNELTKKLPQENYAYYADVANVPYSYKTPEEILGYVEKAVLFLRDKGAKMIVLACNTATNVAVEYLRVKYDFPIVAIQPAVKVAADFDDSKRILAAATPITLAATRYKNLVASLGVEDRITNVALPKLVEFAEKGIFKGEEVEAYLQEQISPYNTEEYHYMVLGCTHFTFYEELIEKLFKNLKTVDGNKGTANQVKRILGSEGMLKAEGSGLVTFYESGVLVSDLAKYIKLMLKLRAS